MVVTGGTGLIQYSIDPSTPNQYVTSGNFTGLGAGNYTIRYKDSKGCFGSSPFTITEPLLALSVISSTVQPACYDDKGTINLIVSGGTTTPASTPPIGYTAVVGNQTQTNFTGNFSFPMLLPGTYPIKVTDANGCMVTDSQIIVAGIRMNQNYIIDYTCRVNPSTNLLEPYNVVQVVVNPSPSAPANEFTYNLDNSGAITGTTLPNGLSGVSYSGLPNGLHTVVVTHTYTTAPFLSCTRSVPFTIKPFTTPILTLALGGLNQFTMSTIGGAPGYSYTVNGNSVTSTTYQVNQTGVYTVVVTDSHGCQDMKPISVTFYDIVIPNFFTPNGDGTNSTWKPLYTDNFPNLITEVYDRYGRKIITLLRNETWDGKYNGNELPSGDYWYVVKLNISTDNREFVGNVTLYR